MLPEVSTYSCRVFLFYYTDFNGGLNTFNAANLLTDNQGRDIQNVQGTTAGALVKRNGLVTFSSPPAAFTSLFALEATASPFLIGAAGTSLYKTTTGGVTSVLKTGLTSGLPWEWVGTQAVGAQGPLYGMNGTDTPQQWDGVAGTSSNWTATSGTVPNGKYMVMAGNRIWVAGVAANPSRVYFSDLIPGNNGAVSWPVANVSSFDENDGSPITGLGHVGPYILVTKARKLYVITDFNTGDARRLSDNIGCISHRSIAQSPDGTFFLGEERGVYLTNGSTIQPVSDNIQPTIDSITAGQRKAAAGTFYNGHYYLSIARNGTPNDTVLDYDTLLSGKGTDSWWLHTFGSSQFAIWHPGGTAGLYSAKGTAAIIDQCFVPATATDNGAQFKWVWRGPWQSPTFYRRRRFPTPYFRKNFRQTRIQGSGTVDVSMATDFFPGEVLRASNVFSPTSSTFAGSGTYGGAGTFGDAASIQLARLFSLGTFNAISLVFSSTSSTVNDTVFSYVLMVTDSRDLVVT